MPPQLLHILLRYRIRSHSIRFGLSRPTVSSFRTMSSKSHTPSNWISALGRYTSNFETLPLKNTSKIVRYTVSQYLYWSFILPRLGSDYFAVSIVRSISTMVSEEPVFAGLFAACVRTPIARRERDETTSLSHNCLCLCFESDWTRTPAPFQDHTQPLILDYISNNRSLSRYTPDGVRTRLHRSDKPAAFH